MQSGEINGILNGDAAKARFDGTVNGWRLAPYEVLAAQGSAGRNLFRACDATRAGPESLTDLDFSLSYLPPGFDVKNESGPSKWVCGGEGLSVMYEYALDTPYGGGSVWAERALWGRRALAVFAARDRVEAASINGMPAIFVHPADDKSGLGQGLIIVIEDDTPPEFTILRLASDNGIPFAELVKIAEGAK